MKRRTSGDGQDDRERVTPRRHVKRVLTQIAIGAAATFLGGLLVALLTTQFWPPAIDPDQAPARTSTPHSMGWSEPHPAPRSTRVATPTVQVASDPRDDDCPSRLDPTRGTPFVYRVREGDTVFRLSFCFDVFRDDLMDANWIEDPRTLYAGTYIIIPHAASTGGPHTGQTMLTPGEKDAIEAFNASVAGLFVRYPCDPGKRSLDEEGPDEAVRSAMDLVCSVLEPYGPVRLLTARPEWKLRPVVADPDFGWEPWQRGAYATMGWLIELQRADGTYMHLTLYESVHYGLGTLDPSPHVSRFDSATNRPRSTIVMSERPG